jgi:hypothetical protein
LHSIKCPWGHGITQELRNSSTWEYSALPKGWKEISIRSSKVLEINDI